MSVAKNTTPTWYKTKAGITMLSITGLILGIFIIFGLMVGYYAIQVKYFDKSAEIEQSLRTQRNAGNKFTNLFVNDAQSYTPTDPTLSIDPNSIIKDYNPVQTTGNEPLTLTMFIDFECPFCQESYPITKELEQKYAGVIKIVFKHFPLHTIHPQAEQSAIAAQCAHEQNTFWDYYDRLFITKQLDETSLINHAKELGLNTNIFTNCLQNQNTRTQIETDLSDGIRAGVQGTPTYILGNTRLEGVLSPEEWDALIVSKLQNL